MSKSHWSERAKSGLRAATEFVADHGAQVGLGGATILGIMGASCTAMALGATDPGTTELYREGAASFTLAAVLKLGGFAAAEQIARVHLNGVDHLFDDPEWKKATQAGVKGAEIESLDDPTQGEDFKAAVKQLFNDLANDPENRAEVISLLRRSPSARKALVDGADSNIAAQHAYNSASTSNQADGEDYDLPPAHGLQ